MYPYPLLYMSMVSEEIKWFLQTENKLQTVHELKLSNSTFTTSVTRGDKENHSGFTGPPIKGEVGDTILFEFNNKASREYSFLAGGVSMSKENEGAVYKQSVGATTSSGATVEPGATYRYEFFVSSINAPTKIDSSCLTYIYRSAVDLENDFYSGMLGPMLKCKRGKLNRAGRQVRSYMLALELYLSCLSLRRRILSDNST
ncbi:HPHL1-like protein [Mya arenaria]|uniref:HPHL1-like protein n=1 Tax=Mya arenaria TaxID=6604 RepID=A0ABY7FDK6_MYAAR|nr:HPHL1-like protein [Mya arenaria]